uniref:Uncharacterized protein n=1 Tax=Fagus sylvatica TaxID=28930 RepID=A0A2N9EF24_FAGSY
MISTRAAVKIEPSSRDSGNSLLHAQELETFSSGQTRGSVAASNDIPSSSGSHPTTYAESSNTATAAPINGEITRTSARVASQGTGARVGSNPTGLNGISIFKRSYLKVPMGSSSNGTFSFCKGKAKDDVIGSRLTGLIDRARRTVRGSADDIGWLQRASGMPPVEDGTERFTEILDNIRHGLPQVAKLTGVLADSRQMHGEQEVFIANPDFNLCLFSNHGPLYFVNAKMSFSKMGLACHIAKIHSEASVEKNAREIKEYIEEIYWGSRKRVLLLGHSKGGVDAAAALSLYWSDLNDKVAGLVLSQSPYGGSPIASDILREGQLGDYVNVRKLMEILICKVIKVC